MTRRALVAGGGLAGITAALALADQGMTVELVEGRPRLGGLAFSFTRDSPAGQLTVDNGQHVYLRCCTAYRGLLRRIGGSSLAPLQNRLDVPVRDAATGRMSRLRRSALPVPLHLSAALARYPHLTVAERLGAARAAWSMRALDPDDPALDQRSFADWLAGQRQSPRSVEALWDLVGVATLNATADGVSLALAAKVFRTGLLTTPGGADIGIPEVPLGELHHTRAGEALDRAGVRVRLRTRVRGLRPDPARGGWQVSSRDAAEGDQEARADVVVLAVPQQQARQLLPAGALPGVGRLAALDDNPILNVHVVYDRPVLPLPFLAAVSSPVQWVFDRTRSSGLATRPGGADSQYLVVSQSAAGAEIDLPVAELRRRYLPELGRLLPRARAAGVRDFFVTRERAATFAPRPGSGELRPGQTTHAPGLFLAGAWTATGWPATMEGAVRSGLAAARAVSAMAADGTLALPDPALSPTVAPTSGTAPPQTTAQREEHL